MSRLATNENVATPAKVGAHSFKAASTDNSVTQLPYADDMQFTYTLYEWFLGVSLHGITSLLLSAIWGLHQRFQGEGAPTCNCEQAADQCNEVDRHRPTSIVSDSFLQRSSVGVAGGL